MSTSDSQTPFTSDRGTPTGVTVRLLAAMLALAAGAVIVAILLVRSVLG